jgi:hypothetical protein
MHSVYDRLNQWIDQLQADQRPTIAPPYAADEPALWQAAASWVARRPGAAEPDPAFLARLGAQLALPREAAPIRARAPAAPPRAGQGVWWQALDRLLGAPFNLRGLPPPLSLTARPAVGGLSLEALFAPQESDVPADPTDPADPPADPPA